MRAKQVIIWFLHSRMNTLLRLGYPASYAIHKNALHVTGIQQQNQAFFVQSFLGIQDI